MAIDVSVEDIDREMVGLDDELKTGLADIERQLVAPVKAEAKAARQRLRQKIAAKRLKLKRLREYLVLRQKGQTDD